MSAPRRVRRDDAALAEIRARRALSARRRAPRGAFYVVPGHEDTPFQLHAVTRDAVVLRSSDGGFLVFDERRGPPEAEWWCDEVPRRTPDEARTVLADYDARRSRDSGQRA